MSVSSFETVGTVCVLLATLTGVEGSELRGVVLSGFDKKPLKRAEVVLRSADPAKTAAGVTTDENGAFTFFDVLPGRYFLQTSRTGYVSNSSVLQGEARLSSPLAIDGDLFGLVVRMQPAANISGKVRHSDGEPASGLMVQAYRDSYNRNRHVYEVAARGITDDRGEYRLYGLPPGRHYVAAMFTPFGGREDVQEQLVRDAYGQLVVPERTVTTFLPSSWKWSEALPLTIAHGLDFTTADIFLAQSRTAVIRGRVRSAKDGDTAGSASLVLLREDGNGTGYIAYPSTARMLDGGAFEFRGVVPGRYVIEGRSADRRGGGVFARQPVTVGNAPETYTNVLLQGEIEVRGVVMAASREERVSRNLQIVAEPRNAGATRRAMLESDGRFTLRLNAGETYDLILQAPPNPPSKAYLKSARMDTTDALGQGLRLDGPTVGLLVLTVGDRGSEIRGETFPGANVALIPREPFLARYSLGAANEWGLFAFGGVAPGDYRLIAWFDDPPCEVWRPLEEGGCLRFGQTVSVREAESMTVSIRP